MQPDIQTIHLARLCSGDDLALQVYQFRGQQPGQKIYIQSNLHGAEIVGNVVIQALLRWLYQLKEQQLAGEIWLVPACNPMGMNQRSHFFSSGRYNPYDGKDWNRIFWDYNPHQTELDQFAKAHFQSSPETIYQKYREQIHNTFQQETQLTHQPSGVPFSVRYQQTLQSLCLDADVVIDIHSSSNQGIDYLFAFPNQENSAQAFLLDVGLLVTEPDGDTFDEAFLKPWLSLERTFAKLGRDIHFGLASWTLELGSGMNANGASVNKGIKGIKNYLANQGVVNGSDFPLPETETHRMNLVDKTQLKKYYAPTGGMVQNPSPLNANIIAGDPIYEILQFNKQGKKPELIPVKAEASGMIFDLGTNQAVNEGEYVLSVLETGTNHDS